MSLGLDPRQRAMLQEMGVRVFWPEALAAGPVAEAEETVPAAPAQARAPAPVARPPAAAPARESPGELARMDWDTLQQAVAAKDGAKVVFGVGDRRPDWLVIGEAPDENAVEQGEPFVGPAGKLLDNMLAALGASRRAKAYVTNVLKSCPPGNRNPEPGELAEAEPFLRRQVELLQPRVILLVGRFAVQALLQTTEPIGRLRGRVHSYHGVPVVVTYHPAYLLRNLPDKAKAWADLVLAQSVVRGG